MAARVIDVEVLRSEFDAYGYDLVMTRGHIVRHIQLKTGSQRRLAACNFEIPKRTTHNKKGIRPQRKNHRLVPKGRFKKIDTLEGVLARLFGDLLFLTAVVCVAATQKEQAGEMLAGR